MNYVLLQHPGHNRVYYNTADKLALAELKLASQRLSTPCQNLKVLEIEQIRYLSFETDAALMENDLQILSRLSFAFALYKVDSFKGETCLIPVKKANYEYLGSKISSLLKYPGKTNELFTRMMINVGLLSGEFNLTEKIRLLDPVAGKGTTLFEAAVYGFDAWGIEIDPKPVHESLVFFKKYLETERIKHQTSNKLVYGTTKSDAITMQEFGYSLTKEEFKTPESTKKLGMICGNSRDAFRYFKKEQFHLMIGDLPYGIFHGNKTGRKAEPITRNPVELLNDCLPEWRKVLFKGGTVVVAWNSFVVSRKKLAEVFSTNEFEVLTGSPFDEFEHMVDKAIKRDILVARKN